MKNPQPGSQVFANVLAGLIVLPIWYYLLWIILTAIKAGELAWFLYWVYVPAGILSLTLARIYAKE